MMKLQPLTSLLGLSFDDTGVWAIRARRRGGKVDIVKAARLNTSLDPLTGNPRFVGREIRQELTDAGFSEKRCVVSVPLSWTLTMRMELPELADEDRAMFIETQAERELPFAPDELRIAVSPFGEDRTRGIALAAIPETRMANLLASLREARLKPASLTCGAAALARTQAGDDSRATIIVGAGNSDLAIAGPRGVSTLRRLSVGADSSHPDHDEFDDFMRQLRIALNALPEEDRDAGRRLAVFAASRPGSEDMARRVGEALSEAGFDAAAQAGRLPESISLNGAGPNVPPSLAAATAMRLRGEPAPFEFLDPWRAAKKAVAPNAIRRRLILVAAALALAVFVAAGAVLWQRWALSGLEAQWGAMAPDVERMDRLTEEVRSARPWFTDPPPTLETMLLLTEAFPERGTVWATSIKIEDSGEVAITGKARDEEDLLDVRDALSRVEGVENLSVAQIQDSQRQGDAVRFTLHFLWTPGGAR